MSTFQDQPSRTAHGAPAIESMLRAGDGLTELGDKVRFERYLDAILESSSDEAEPFVSLATLLRDDPVFQARFAVPVAERLESCFPSVEPDGSLTVRSALVCALASAVLPCALSRPEYGSPEKVQRWGNLLSGFLGRSDGSFEGPGTVLRAAQSCADLLVLLYGRYDPELPRVPMDDHVRTVLTGFVTRLLDERIVSPCKPFPGNDPEKMGIFRTYLELAEVLAETSAHEPLLEAAMKLGLAGAELFPCFKIRLYPDPDGIDPTMTREQLLGGDLDDEEDECEWRDDPSDECTVGDYLPPIGICTFDEYRRFTRDQTLAEVEEGSFFELYGALLGALGTCQRGLEAVPLWRGVLEYDTSSAGWGAAFRGLARADFTEAEQFLPLLLERCAAPLGEGDYDVEEDFRDADVLSLLKFIGLPGSVEAITNAALELGADGIARFVDSVETEVDIISLWFEPGVNGDLIARRWEKIQEFLDPYLPAADPAEN